MTEKLVQTGSSNKISAWLTSTSRSAFRFSTCKHVGRTILLVKRSKQNRSFCIGAQDSYMTWAELGPRKGIGQTDISIRTQSPPELAKKEKIPPICTPKHEKSRYCDRIAHRLSERGLTPSKIPYFSNSTRGFITEFSETIQP